MLKKTVLIIVQLQQYAKENDIHTMDIDLNMVIKTKSLNWDFFFYSDKYKN